MTVGEHTSEHCWSEWERTMFNGEKCFHRSCKSEAWSLTQITGWVSIVVKTAQLLVATTSSGSSCRNCLGHILRLCALGAADHVVSSGHRTMIVCVSFFLFLFFTFQSRTFRVLPPWWAGLPISISLIGILLQAWAVPGNCREAASYVILNPQLRLRVTNDGLAKKIRGWFTCIA